jgi:hypothetical protein
MGEKLYREVLRYTAKTDGIAMLSGGEPTEHPQILDFIRLARSRLGNVVVLSNGSWLAGPHRERLLGSWARFQITNDERYYPKRVPIVEHERLFYEYHIQTLLRLGRSAQSAGRLGPSCFNLQSMGRSIGSFIKTIRALRKANKFCSPSIGVRGTIRAGESNVCWPLGKVGDMDGQLLRALKAHDCDRCGLHGQLPEFALERIGKARG